MGERTVQRGRWSGVSRISVFSWILIAVLVLQFAAVCYFNLTQLENHLGYDSSWDVLKASLMWKEKRFIPVPGRKPPICSWIRP